MAHHGNRRQRANRQRDSLLHGGVGNRLMASQRPAFFLDRTANREFPLPAARLGVRLSGASILVQRVQQRVLLGTRVPDHRVALQRHDAHVRSVPGGHEPGQPAKLSRWNHFRNRAAAASWRYVRTQHGQRHSRIVRTLRPARPDLIPRVQHRAARLAEFFGDVRSERLEHAGAQHLFGYIRQRRSLLGASLPRYDALHEVDAVPAHDARAAPIFSAQRARRRRGR